MGLGGEGKGGVGATHRAQGEGAGETKETAKTEANMEEQQWVDWTKVVTVAAEKLLQETQKVNISRDIVQQLFFCFCF